MIISYTFPSYHTHRPRRGEGDVVDMIRRVQERVANLIADGSGTYASLDKDTAAAAVLGVYLKQ